MFVDRSNFFCGEILNWLKMDAVFSIQVLEKKENNTNCCAKFQSSIQNNEGIDGRRFRVYKQNGIMNLNRYLEYL